MINITVPEIHHIWYKNDNWRFCFLHGGRGAGSKSKTVCKYLIEYSFKYKTIILCVRETEKSIANSVTSAFKIEIEALNLSEYFTITKDYIRNNYTGTEIRWQGLQKHTADALKSFANIDKMVCWVEEGQSISQESWDKLTPTIRSVDSKIIITCNPDTIEDAVYRRFCKTKSNPWYYGDIDEIEQENQQTIKTAKKRYIEDLLKNNKIIKKEQEYIYEEEKKSRIISLYCPPYSNPWFRDSVLEVEMLRDKKHDFELYETKWLGKPLSHSNAQIFRNKWRVDNFEAPDNTVFYFGVDWGNEDPTVLTRCYIVGDSKDQYSQTLYIDYSVRTRNSNLNDIAILFNKVPNVPKKQYSNRIIYADSNWPQSTQEMQINYGFNIQSVEKWPNSVKQGIMYLRSFKEIVIHERCIDLIDEFKMYQYKVNARTNEIEDEILGKYDHGPDSLRYALSPLIKFEKKYSDNFIKAYNRE